MAYEIKGVYHFKDENSKGIDKVPNGRLVIIENYNGAITVNTNSSFSKIEVDLYT